MKLIYGVFAANTNILDGLRHWVAKIYINQSCLYCKNITNYLIFFEFIGMHIFLSWSSLTV